MAAPPLCFGRRATIVGNNGSNTLQGTSASDVIVGLRGNDTIYGASGDDYICGSGGADQLFGETYDDHLHGGNGNDELFGGRAVDEGDFLIGGAGNDRFTAQDNFGSDATPDTLDYSRTAAAIRVDIAAQTITGAGTDFIVDVPQLYEILGTAYNDVFSIGSGHGPQMSGQSGADAFYGGPYIDSFVGGAGDDQMFSYGGADSLSGGTENWDPVEGVDYVESGSGDDFIGVVDGAGDDTAYAGDGADRCFVDAGDAVDSCDELNGE